MNRTIRRVFEVAAFDEVFPPNSWTLGIPTAATRACNRSATPSTICRAELPCNDIIQDGLEVIEENGIRCAFEHEGEPPVWIDTAACSEVCGSDDDICEQENYGQCHA